MISLRRAIWHPLPPGRPSDSQFPALDIAPFWADIYHQRLFHILPRRAPIHRETESPRPYTGWCKTDDKFEDKDGMCLRKFLPLGIFCSSRSQCLHTHFCYIRSAVDSCSRLDMSWDWTAYKLGDIP